MSKKSASARSNAQRSKPKSQKSVQLVRAAARDDQRNLEGSDEQESTGTVATSIATAPESVSDVEEETTTQIEVEDAPAPVSARRARTASSAKTARGTAPVAPVPVAATAPASTAAKSNTGGNTGSASARMAARRQAAQKAQQRQAPELVTAEHYAYVRKDLIFIAILAIIFFSTLIILHFVPAIGG